MMATQHTHTHTHTHRVLSMVNYECLWQNQNKSSCFCHKATEHHPAKLYNDSGWFSHKTHMCVCVCVCVSTHEHNVTGPYAILAQYTVTRTAHENEHGSDEDLVSLWCEIEMAPVFFLQLFHDHNSLRKTGSSPWSQNRISTTQLFHNK